MSRIIPSLAFGLAMLTVPAFAATTLEAGSRFSCLQLAWAWMPPALSNPSARAPAAPPTW